jgi:hypothetical protein
VTVALPGVTAVTMPDGDTVAIAMSDVAHEIERDNGRPFRSLAVAVSCRVAAGTSDIPTCDKSMMSVVGGGAVGLSPQDPIVHPSAIDPIVRYNLFMTEQTLAMYAQRPNASSCPRLNPYAPRAYARKTAQTVAVVQRADTFAPHVNAPLKRWCNSSRVSDADIRSPDRRMVRLE